jgi:hypothetical protein
LDEMEEELRERSAMEWGARRRRWEGRMRSCLRRRRRQAEEEGGAAAPEMDAIAAGCRGGLLAAAAAAVWSRAHAHPAAEGGGAGVRAREGFVLGGVHEEE